MKTLMRLTILFLILGVLYTNADIPRMLNYQGKLTDPDGVAVSGSTVVIFRIYDAETDGNLKWEEGWIGSGDQRRVFVVNGLFSVALGSNGSPIDTLSFSQSYWVEIEVEGEILSPRTSIQSVGYSYRSLYSDSAGLVYGSAGGDLSGNYPNPTVDGLQGRGISSTAPTEGQILTWNSGLSQWEPQDDGGEGELDYTQKWELIATPTVGSWTTANLGGFTVPANTVCEINISPSVSGNYGVREVGSPQNRVVTDDGSITMNVKTDASSDIEYYRGNTADFYLAGYWNTPSCLSPTASAGTDGSTCGTTPYALDGTATDEESILWTTSGTGSFDDESLEDPTYTPSGADVTAGSVTLTMTANATPPCTDDDDNMTLTIVADLSDVAIAPTGAQNICESTTGSVLTCTPTGGGTPSYQWGKRATPGGAITDITGETSSTYTPDGSDLGVGTWFIVCTVTPECGSAITSNEVTVDVTADLSDVAIAPTGAQDICESTTGSVLTCTPTDGGTPSYQWGKRATPGGAITDITGETSSTYTPDGSDLGVGTWFIVCTITPECGSAITSNEVTVDVTADLSDVAIAPTAEQNITTSETGDMLTCTPTDGGTPSYQWGKRSTSGGAITGLSGETSSTYTPDGSVLGVGTWYIVCTVTPECGSVTTSNEVTVNVTTAIMGHIVFISSSDFLAGNCVGGLYGYSGACDSCMALAADAGLTGTYKAILSDAGGDVVTRLTLFDEAYYNTNGDLVSSNGAGFWDGSLDHAILYDENGTSRGGTIWTGSYSDGTWYGGVFNAACGNWTSCNPTYMGGGRAGNGGSTTGSWLSSSLPGCGNTGIRIYCIEVNE